MSLYRHIVVATDLSAEGDAAVNVALSTALQHFARLSVLHIIDERVMQYQDVLPLTPTEMEEMLLLELRRKLLGLADAKELDSLSYEAHVIFGKPHEEIERFCQKEQAELVIVGQRGKNLVKTILLGSTAERLIRHSTLPTLVVPSPSPRRYERVLAPVDFSEASDVALRHAIELCKAGNCSLHVLHVCEDNLLASLSTLLPQSDTQSIQSSYEQKVEKNFHEFLENFDFQGQAYERCFRRGEAPAEIQQCANDLGADLVVMGSIGRTGVRGIVVGNTAERVARSLSCSLLVLKPAATI